MNVAANIYRSIHTRLSGLSASYSADDISKDRKCENRSRLDVCTIFRWFEVVCQVNGAFRDELGSKLADDRVFVIYVVLVVELDATGWSVPLMCRAC